MCTGASQRGQGCQLGSQDEQRLSSVWQSFHPDLGVGYTCGCFIIICKQHIYTFSSFGHAHCVSKEVQFKKLGWWLNLTFGLIVTNAIHMLLQLDRPNKYWPVTSLDSSKFCGLQCCPERAAIPSSGPDWLCTGNLHCRFLLENSLGLSGAS